MTPQIVGLIRAQKMRDLGFPQDIETKWWIGDHKMTYVGAKAAPGIGLPKDDKGWCAYTIEEMKKWMPQGHEDKRLLEKTNKANNFADVLIELKEAGKIIF